MWYVYPKAFIGNYTFWTMSVCRLFYRTALCFFQILEKEILVVASSWWRHHHPPPHHTTHQTTNITTTTNTTSPPPHHRWSKPYRKDIKSIVVDCKRNAVLSIKVGNADFEVPWCYHILWLLKVTVSCVCVRPEVGLLDCFIEVYV
jgi:hypothetical protein